jgi:adenylate cyclase
LADKVANFRGRPIGDLILRGRVEPMRVIEPLRADAWENNATKTYLAAFAKLEANDPGALSTFASHVGANPHEQLAAFHLKRLLNGATGTRIAME